MEKKSTKSGVLRAVLLAAALLCTGWTGSWQQIRAAAKRVNAIRADFIQKKHMSILVHPLVSTGRLDYRAPDNLRWEYLTPVSSLLLMHNGVVRRYFRIDGKLTQDAGLNTQAFNIVLQEITQWLNGQFDENPTFRARLGPGSQIVLVPRDKAFARMILRIEVNLARQPGIIRSVAIYEPGDSLTRLEFKNITVNHPINDSVFRKSK